MSDTIDPAVADQDVTITNHIDYVTGGRRLNPNLIRWPPDVFAVAASLLHRSGAYT